MWRSHSSSLTIFPSAPNRGHSPEAASQKEGRSWPPDPLLPQDSQAGLWGDLPGLVEVLLRWPSDSPDHSLAVRQPLPTQGGNRNRCDCTGKRGKGNREGGTHVKRAPRDSAWITFVSRELKAEHVLESVQITLQRHTLPCPLTCLSCSKGVGFLPQNTCSRGA